MIVITLEGGCLVDVFATDPTQECVLIDSDVEGCDAECEADRLVFDGDSPEAYAVDVNVAPLDNLADPENYTGQLVRKMRERDKAPPLDPPYGGYCCPKCDSKNITGGELRPDGPRDVHYDVACDDCGAAWVELYHLTGFTDLTTPEDQ